MRRKSAAVLASPECFCRGVRSQLVKHGRYDRDRALIRSPGRAVSLSGGMAQEAAMGDGYSADCKRLDSPARRRRNSHARIPPKKFAWRLTSACGWIRNPVAYLFLGRVLRHGDVGLWKLSLFRRGRGRYECRLMDQDASMADMEVHEHVVVEGATAKLRNPLIHHNVESLSRYIQKHDEYSNWESRLLLQRGARKELPPSLLGTQAQRRRWLKRKLMTFLVLPCFSSCIAISFD